MFDAVISKKRGPQSNAAGFGLSAAIWGGIIVAIVGFSAARQAATKEVDVTLFAAAPPPPPPPPAGGSSTPTPQKKPVKRKKDVVVQPKVETKETPKPAEPEPSEEPKNDPAGVPGGVVGGVAGGVVGGVVGGTGTAAVPFGAGMTRPQQLSGGQPQYTPEAIAARVEGKVIVKCVITATGEVRDCKVIKGLPMLEQVVLTHLKHARFSPVTFQGRPVAVQYIFPFSFKLP